MSTKSSRCTFPIILCTAIALLALASLGCEAEDACYQFCIETLACDHETDDADYQQLLDECYQVYQDQGVGDPVLGAGIETACQASLDAWTGCPEI